MSKVDPPAQAPGLAVEVAPVSPDDRSAVRTDIAGFLGRTRRGPVRVGAGAAPCRVRVEGQTEFNTLFGRKMLKGAYTPYAVNGYFENDGQVAHIIRLAGPASRTASALWDLSDALAKGKPVEDGFGWSRFQFCGSSPGCWANGAKVTLTYSRQGVSGTPAVDVSVQADGEPTEIIRGIIPHDLADQINTMSKLIRVAPVEGSKLSQCTGLGSLTQVQTLTLDCGQDDPPSLQTYLDAIQSMGDEPEVAFVALPDLYDDIEDDSDRLSVLAAAVALADQRQDQLVLVDVPPGLSASKDVIQWVTNLQASCQAVSSLRSPDTPRSAAVYHPWLWVPDPLGTTPDDSRLLLPPSGHVAGLISRLDRQRGAHYTPANAALLQAFDVAQGFRASERAVLNAAGVNLIRCFPNQGLLVWGGRTLGTKPGDIYVAHRRLLHRLVRAIRAVALPLVFDVNGPAIWLTLVRAITTVLLQAYRAGALAGTTPSEAFSVQCDAQTNPPEAIDTGRVLCLVSVAPAVPMEFILLKITLDTEGRLEVLQ
jgi:hypothetical protein